MKVIFLDIDGVLCSEVSLKQYMSPNENRNSMSTFIQWKMEQPDPFHIKTLNSITDASEAHLVISSSWRDEFSVVGWNRYFVSLGIHAPVLDVTPRLKTYRGTEIAAWLLSYHDKHWKDTQHERLESFLILDDDYDYVYDFLQSRWLLVNTREGLNESYIDTAVSKLQSPFNFATEFLVQGNKNHVLL